MFAILLQKNPDFAAKSSGKELISTSKRILQTMTGSPTFMIYSVRTWFQLRWLQQCDGEIIIKKKNRKKEHHICCQKAKFKLSSAYYRDSVCNLNISTSNGTVMSAVMNALTFHPSACIFIIENDKHSSFPFVTISDNSFRSVPPASGNRHA